MNYVCISIVGCGFYMIPRLCAVSDTEKVFFFCRDFAKMEKLGRNMEQMPGWEKYERVKDFGEPLKKLSKDNTIVIFDDNGFGFTADNLRNQGWKVVGGSETAEKMESDRWWSIQLMQKVMDVPETYYYNTFDEGLAFLKSREKSERWVFKPQDAEVPKDKTHVGKDINDLVTVMQTFKTNWQWKDGYVLQAFVDGVEGDMSMYFDGNDYLENSLSWYFENKPFLAGDIGPATGGEIAVSFFRPASGVAKEIFDKLKPLLQKANYHGQLAINCMFSKEDHKPYFLELTPRFGYPSLEVELTLAEENGKSLVDLIKQLANGKGGSLFPTDKIGGMVTVSIPPYPIDEAAEFMVNGTPISWDKKWDSYMFPWFMMKGKKGYELCGFSGHALSVTCAAKTLSEVVEMIYDEYIPSIQLPNKQYRSDMGEDAKKRIQQLRDWGVIA